MLNPSILKVPCAECDGRTITCGERLCMADGEHDCKGCNGQGTVEYVLRQVALRAMDNAVLTETLRKR